MTLPAGTTSLVAAATGRLRVPHCRSRQWPWPAAGRRRWALAPAPAPDPTTPQGHRRTDVHRRVRCRTLADRRPCSHGRARLQRDRPYGELRGGDRRLGAALAESDHIGHCDRRSRTRRDNQIDGRQPGTVVVAPGLWLMTAPADTVALAPVVIVPTSSLAATIVATALACGWPTTLGTEIVAGALTAVRLTVELTATLVPAAGSARRRAQRAERS